MEKTDKMMGNLKNFAFVMTLAVGLSAQAQIVVPSTTVTYNSYNVSGYSLSITYEVTGTPGDYTYSYDLTTTPGEPLETFAIGNGLDPVDTAGVVLLAEGGIDMADSTVSSDSIIFEWDAANDIMSSTVGYTSPNAPSLATFAATDDDIFWESPASIPAPVPETSTVVAGLMMLMPLAFATVRALRRERKALVPVRKN